MGVDLGLQRLEIGPLQSAFHVAAAVDFLHEFHVGFVKFPLHDDDQLALYQVIGNGKEQIGGGLHPLKGGHGHLAAHAGKILPAVKVGELAGRAHGQFGHFLFGNLHLSGEDGADIAGWGWMPVWPACTTAVFLTAFMRTSLKWSGPISAPMILNSGAKK